MADWANQADEHKSMTPSTLSPLPPSAVCGPPSAVRHPPSTFVINNTLPMLFADANQVFGCLLEGVVVADHEELAESLNVEDLAGERLAPGFIQVAGGFIEEGHVDGAHLAQ
jgi:hypothetical protein